MTKYDIAIIGSGPGGYVAALYAAGCGKKVLIVEKDRLGGVCLNWGCIPTKTLLASAKTLNTIKRSKEFGIEVGSYNINLPEIRKRKDNVINTLKNGIETLFKTKNIDLKKGHGRIAGKGIIEVDNEKFEAENIIIATGSRPAELPDFKFDNKRVLMSASILDLDTLPKKLLIIGGGVNGCEYAYLYQSLGVQVTIVEMLDRLLPTMDRELGKKMEMILKKLGVDVRVKTKLTSIPKEYDKVTVCVGRKLNSEDIGLEKLNIKTDKGRIIVDKAMKTSAPNVYAIGDVTGGYLLAHVASHEGIVACDNIMGNESNMNYESVPLCIYTDPQIASVGLTDKEAIEDGFSAKVAKIPLRAIGKAHALGEKEGFIKIVYCQKRGRVLGVHMIGPEAAEIIHEAVVLVKTKAKVKDITETIHAHPTLSEALQEAAFIADKRPIHSI